MKPLISIALLIFISCSPFARIKKYEIETLSEGDSFTIGTQGVDKNSRSTNHTFLELFQIYGGGVDSVQISFESNRMILTYKYPNDKNVTEKIVVGAFEQKQYFQSVELIKDSEIINHEYKEIKRIGLRQDNEIIVSVIKKEKSGFFIGFGGQKKLTKTYVFKSSKTRRRRVSETGLYRE